MDQVSTQTRELPKVHIWTLHGWIQPPDTSCAGRGANEPFFMGHDSTAVAAVGGSGGGVQVLPPPGAAVVFGLSSFPRPRQQLGLRQIANGVGRQNTRIVCAVLLAPSLGPPRPARAPPRRSGSAIRATSPPLAAASFPRSIDMAAPPPAPPAAAAEPGLRAGTSAFLVIPPADTDPRWASAKEWSLTGAPPLGLMRLLWTHWAKVDLRHRGVAARLRATVLPSLLNGFLGLVDWVVHGRAIAATPLCERPVFVLGLARSGTTMLHELLAADTDQFVTPDTFQVVHPSSFLTLRPLRQRLLAGALKPTRPMDNVAQSWDGTASGSLSMCPATWGA